MKTSKVVTFAAIAFLCCCASLPAQSASPSVTTWTYNPRILQSLGALVPIGTDMTPTYNVVVYNLPISTSAVFVTVRYTQGGQSFVVRRIAETNDWNNGKRAWVWFPIQDSKIELTGAITVQQMTAARTDEVTPLSAY